MKKLRLPGGKPFALLFKVRYGIPVLILFAALAVGQAQQSWNTTSGIWSTNANWAPGPHPDAIGAQAQFLLSGGGTRTITLDTPVTLGSLDINSTSRYIITGNTLTLDDGANPAFISSGSTGLHIISSDLVIDSEGLAIDVNSSTLVLNGSRSGGGDLIKSGSGTLNLNGSTSFSGDTQIQNGRIIYSASGALQDGSTVTVGDGIGAASSADLSIWSSMSSANALEAQINSDGVLFQGNNRLVRLLSASGTGEIRLNSAFGNGFEFMGSGSANDSTFSGTLSGGIAVAGAPDPAAGSRLNKTGTSTLTLDGNNNYNARTFISGGAIRAASSTALGSSAANSGTYVHGTGSLELSGSVTLAEVIALNGSGTGGVGALRSVADTNTLTQPVQLGWAGGSVTAQDVAIGADAGTTLNLQGGLSGTTSLNKVGSGTVRLGASDGRSGAFSTTVSGGTVALNASGGNAIAGATLTLNSGGTLMLEASNQISDSTNLNLSGGTLSTGTGFDETLGTLTLTSSSTISLASSLHLLTFANSASATWNSLASLSIFGWQGDLTSGGTAGRIFFEGGSSGLSSSQLSHIQFSGFGIGAQILSSGELVPVAVPESKTILAALLLAGVLTWRERFLLTRFAGRFNPYFSRSESPRIDSKNIRTATSGI